MDPLSLLMLSAVLLLLVALILENVDELMSWIAKRVSRHRDGKRAEVEAELDRQQAELRATIYSLASQLGADAHEARKALIRESYRASRDELPPPR